MYDYSRLDTDEILSILFHPRREPQHPAPAECVDFDFTVEGDITVGGRLFGQDKSAPTLLYFHGNGEIVSEYNDIGPMYNKVGLNLLVVDYRGYGWSGGTPTVTSMFQDAEVIFTATRQYLKDNAFSGPLMVMGRSLGSVCAIDLALKFQDDITALFVESGFANTLPLARSLGYDVDKYELQESDCFQNLEKIKEVTIPTLIIHGVKDQLIPMVEGERLQVHSGAKTKQFSVIPGADHSSLIAVAGDLYFDNIKQFVDKITGATNWRRRRKKNIRG